MQFGQQSSLRLIAADSVYVLLAIVAAAWQSWCITSNGPFWLVLLMGLPFALASLAHASILNRTGDIARRPSWKQFIFLWVGMPISFFAAALAILAQTGAMYAAGLGIDNLPFDTPRLFVGQGVACLFWAECLIQWSKSQPLYATRKRVFVPFALLYAGVLLSYLLSQSIYRHWSKDLDWPVVSIVETLISAVFVMLEWSHAHGRSGPRRAESPQRIPISHAR